MSFEIEVNAGSSVKLPTAGKYCDRDIVVTATGGDGGYDEGYVEGLEDGKQQAIENLPNGYIKIDPTWTSLAYFCHRRASVAENIKYNDTANIQNFSNMCNDCPAKIIPSWNTRQGETFNSMFIYSEAEEIGEMDISNATNINAMYANCYQLKRVWFVPGCIKLSISFAQSSKLEDVAIQSIIDGLADLTGQTAQTLTFHRNVYDILTEEQKATVAAKNWTLVRA